MKRSYLFFLLTALLFLNLKNNASSQIIKQNSDSSDIDFDRYFIQKTLRIDFTLAGDYASETAFLNQLKQEPFWGGNKKNLIDPFSLGTYRFQVFDSVSGKLIFSRGLNTLFQEWRGTSEAKVIKKAFSQVAIMPFPKNAVHIIFAKRNFEDGLFSTIFDCFVNPNDYMINREKPYPWPYIKFRDSGNPSQKVDVAFIAEGYKVDEMSKFIKDAQRISDYLLSISPYSEFRSKFNFYAILSPSSESGVDVPGKGKYVNTVVNISFYTFGMDRYMTTFDARSIYDIAAIVPYDAIIVLVNSDMYGGGGFYNHYAAVAADNTLSKLVAVHEFGHSFAGLADEYMGDISYSDTYNLKVEPWEPNITTNVDFSSKWKTMIHEGTPIPTSRTEDYENSVGMFEGGGYVTKGIYSPFEDCRMKSNEASGFCPVCQRAIRRMILFYCE